MKLGAENKKKAAGAVALLLFSVVLLVRTFWTSAPDAVNAPTAPGVAAPAQKPRSRVSLHRYVAFTLAPTLDPRLRFDLLQTSEHVPYEGTGRNIFDERMEAIPTPIAQGLTKASVKPKWTPAGPPTPPPIDLKFYGWASQSGEPRAIFLSKGADVFIAHEGDIVARRYKIVRITPNSVEIEDVLSNNKQSIPLTQG